MPLFDYRCSCGLATEAIRPSDVRTIPCPCGRDARRAVAHRVQVVGPTTDTRGMYSRFREASQEMEYAASAAEASTGEAAPSPPLWEMAKAKAAAITTAGESSDVLKSYT